MRRLLYSMLSIGVLSMVVLGCNQQDMSSHLLPLNADGVVSYAKYYRYVRAGERDPYVDIRYISSTRSHDTLVIEQYDAAMDLIHSTSMLVAGPDWLVLEEFSRSYRAAMDSAYVEYPRVILDSVYLDGSGRGGQYQSKVDYSWGSMVLTDRQRVVADTTVINSTAVAVSGTRVGQTIVEGDTTNFSGQWSRVYVEGLGLFSHVITYDRGDTIRLQLDRTLTPGEWDAIQSSTPERVAFLHPTDDGYTTCGPTRSIYDYYNDERARIIQPRSQVKADLDQIVQGLNLEPEVSIITVHYVINCRGEVGRHRVDTYDSNYEPIAILPSRYDAVVSYLSNDVNYRPLRVRGQPTDSYAYTLIKITDGVVSDILP